MCVVLCVWCFINQGCCLGVRIKTFEAWRMSQMVKHLVSYFTLPTPAKLFAKGFTPDIVKCHTHSTLGTPIGHATRQHTLLKSLSIKKSQKDMLTQDRPQCQSSATSVHVLLPSTPEWPIPAKNHEWMKWETNCSRVWDSGVEDMKHFLLVNYDLLLSGNEVVNSKAC